MISQKSLHQPNLPRCRYYIVISLPSPTDVKQMNSDIIPHNTDIKLGHTNLI